MQRELEEKFLAELESNKASLLRICSVYATDSEMKKDYFQESVFNIWKSLPSFTGKSSLSTWMYRITINVCLGLNKKQKRAKLDFIEIIEEKGQMDVAKQTDPRLEKLKQCIKKLNTSDKTIISLYLEELPYKEIATIIGITENHVAVKVKRIKKKLFNCINQNS